MSDCEEINGRRHERLVKQMCMGRILNEHDTYKEEKK